MERTIEEETEIRIRRQEKETGQGNKKARGRNYKKKQRDKRREQDKIHKKYDRQRGKKGDVGNAKHGKVSRDTR
jgi:hypothetical protein